MAQYTISFPSNLKQSPQIARLEKARGGLLVSRLRTVEGIPSRDQRLTTADSASSDDAPSPDITDANCCYSLLVSIDFVSKLRARHNFIPRFQKRLPVVLYMRFPEFKAQGAELRACPSTPRRRGLLMKAEER